MLVLGVASQEGTSPWENISCFITLSHGFFPDAVVLAEAVVPHML